MFKNITVAGGGVLGSQIAFQSAYCGFNVTIYLVDEEAKEQTLIKLNNLKETYKNDIKKMSKDYLCKGISDIDTFNQKECLKKVDDVIENINLETDLKKSLENADLLIESIPEDLNIKSKFYESINDIISDETVIVTNSSTLLPSVLSKHVKNSSRFLSLHFANHIWRNNTAEIMGHNGTEQKYFDEVVEFATNIRMIPLKINKEKAGYLLNSLLVPFLLCAMDLLANEVSDPETIDKAWKLGAPKGPFEILDVVGLETAKNIVEQYIKVPNLLDPLFKKMMLPYSYDKMLVILNDYIANNKLGRQSGEGFYKYNK